MRLCLQKQLNRQLWNSVNSYRTTAVLTIYLIARPQESQLKVEFLGVPYNQTFLSPPVCEDFDAGLFVKNVDNRLGYFDKILHTQWYWQDVAQEIVKCHLGLAAALPRFKFWKSENNPISWTEWNILINFCVNIDIKKI